MKFKYLFQYFYILSLFNIYLEDEITPQMQREFGDYLQLCLKSQLIPYKNPFSQKPKISIIIPIYNKSGYLLLSILSVLNQSFKDIEVICVDDYSSDNSREVIKKLQSFDQRIKLILNEKNRGTLYTRINGLLHSNGEYIMFVDPDDLLCNKLILEKAYTRAIKYNIDIVHFKILRCSYYDNKFSHWEGVLTPPKKENILSQPELLEFYFTVYPEGYLFNKLFKRTLIPKIIKFLGEDLYSQHLTVWDDGFITFPIMKFANNYTFLDEFGYWYNLNEISATKDIFYFTGNQEKDKKNNIKIGEAIVYIENLLNWTDEIAISNVMRRAYVTLLHPLTEPIYFQYLPYSKHFNKILELLDRNIKWKLISQNAKEACIYFKNNLLNFKAKLENKINFKNDYNNDL